MIIDCMRDPSRREEAIRDAKRPRIQMERGGPDSLGLVYVSTPYGSDYESTLRAAYDAWEDERLHRSTPVTEETASTTRLRQMAAACGELVELGEVTAFDIETVRTYDEVREISPQARKFLDGETSFEWYTP